MGLIDDNELLLERRTDDLNDANHDLEVETARWESEVEMFNELEA